MRQIMLIVENASLTLFHGSRKNLPIGTVLKASRQMHREPESKAVEMILEHFRPEHCLPRNQCVYMLDTADAERIEQSGGYANHVYRVEPVGAVERNDVHWWGMILTHGAYEFMDASKAAQALILQTCATMAKAYWDGQPSDRPLWEFRARNAVIVEEIDESE